MLWLFGWLLLMSVGFPQSMLCPTRLQAATGFQWLTHGANCRDWLLAYNEAGAAHTAASAADQSLHNALLKTGMITNVKQVYALTKAANGGPADALRGVLLNTFKDKPNVRRADVFDAARAEGLNVSDGVYQKVMKDLCVSKGNVWTLKTGA